MPKVRLAGCRAVSLVAALLVCAPVAAQTVDPSAPGGVMPLEQLMSAEVRTVFGASRYLQRIVDAPAAVSVVTAEEIDRFAWRTLADILRGVRGLYVSYDRNYSYLGVRGMSRPGDYNTRVLLLVDGHRLNDNVYDQAALGTEFPLDVDLIERIEVIRGPSSTIYGTNAVFAVVNVVTKRGAALSGISGAVEAGGLGTRRGRVTAAGALPAGGDFLVSATAYGSDGQRSLQVPGLDGPPHPDLDRDSFGQVFSSVRLGRWTAQGLLGSREKGIPTGAFGVVLDDRRTATTDTRGYVNLQYLGDWRGTALRLRGAYDAYHYDGTYVYTSGVDVDQARGQWWSGELSGSRRRAGHLVTAGLELRGNVQQDQKLYDLASGQSSLDIRHESFVWSLYAQDEITLTPRVLLNASAGYDRFTIFGGEATYRGALIYKPTPNRAWKAIHGRAFRTPNVYELYYYTHEGHVDHLTPEVVYSLEVTGEQYVGAGLRLAGSLFHNRIVDGIAQVAEPRHRDGVHFENVDRLQTNGVSVELERMFATGLHVFGSYVLTHATDTSGARASNSPRHLTAARATAPLFGRTLFAAIELRQMSERRGVDGSTVEGATIGRLSVSSREFAARWRAQATVNNLFGAEYADPGSEEHPVTAIRQDGRTVLVRMTWRF